MTRFVFAVGLTGLFSFACSFGPSVQVAPLWSEPHVAGQPRPCPANVVGAMASASGSKIVEPLQLRVSGKNFCAIVVVRDGETFGELWRTKMPEAVRAVAIDPSGTFVAVLSGANVSVFKAADGELIKAIPESRQSKSVALGRTRLAVPSGNVYSVPELEVVRTDEPSDLVAYSNALNTLARATCVRKQNGRFTDNSFRIDIIDGLGNKVGTFEDKEKHAQYCPAAKYQLVLNHNGSAVAYRGDKKIFLFDQGGYRVAESTYAQGKRAMSLDLSQDGHHLIVAKSAKDGDVHYLEIWKFAKPGFQVLNRITVPKKDVMVRRVGDAKYLLRFVKSDIDEAGQCCIGTHGYGHKEITTSGTN